MSISFLFALWSVGWVVSVMFLSWTWALDVLSLFCPIFGSFPCIYPWLINHCLSSYTSTSLFASTSSFILLGHFHKISKGLNMIILLIIIRINSQCKFNIPSANRPSLLIDSFPKYLLQCLFITLNQLIFLFPSSLLIILSLPKIFR